jgi:hypothetical protein
VDGSMLDFENFQKQTYQFIAEDPLRAVVRGVN